MRSHLEAKVDVFYAVSDVNATILAGAALVVSSEACPQIVSNDGDFVRRVWLNSPAAHGDVCRDLVEEVRLENSIISQQCLLLLCVLAISKV